ncbi:hypothetical protein AYL99_08105 [Fonsecaea erecta]|uniref:Sister chromatid cohesion protein Dcc1 n=1 Tax=Fonsecaea erecta TaxID=1367422 RepID=A0A178ZC63_9EURO|nr:hypothetical protein AYL99_08105 [Fonsecaea erecta]OAP57367.1 hypothetical protein AYL99_08105 [Fonsecaea erecta]
MSASSQPSAFPPVAVSSTLPHQSLRLLELPAELLDVVEAQIKNPSKRRKLWFKSSAAAKGQHHHHQQRPFGSSSLTTPVAAEEGGGRGGDFLHLCTDDKIWAVKQVSTSNSVYVTQTCHQPRATQNQQGVGEDGGAPPSGGGHAEEQVDEIGLAVAAGSRGGITTKAQVKNVLELIEVESDERAVHKKVHDMVPVYHDEGEDDHRHVLDRDPREAVSMRDVLDNIAAPTRMVRDVMRKSFIFGLSQTTTSRKGAVGHEERVYLASPSLLLRHWKEFLQQCTISGIDLAKNNDNVLAGADLHAVLNGLAAEAAAAEETEEAGRRCSSLARNVTMAIVRRFTDVPDMDLDLDWDQDLSLFADSIGSARLKFNPNLTRDMVGRWLLLSHHARRKSSPLSTGAASSSSSSRRESDHGTMRVDDFTTEWTQLLPDSWAVECSNNVASLISSVVDLNVDLTRDREGVAVLRFVASSHGAEEASHAPSHSSAAAAAAASSMGVPGLAKDAQSENQKKRKWHEKFGAQRSAPAVRK